MHLFSVVKQSKKNISIVDRIGVIQDWLKRDEANNLPLPFYYGLGENKITLPPTT